MPDNSRRQYHVNLAVAYNVWQHWQVTGDLGFLLRHGAELLVETTRFFACRASADLASSRYDLRGVMGPDEFHDVIGPALGGELWDRIGLATGELDHWDLVSRGRRVPFLRSGLLAQFEGYDDLAELDWPRYCARYGDIGRLDLLLEAEGDLTNRYKASKQADVLMLFYLLSAKELAAVLGRLGYDLDTSSIPATVDYYLARASHGSTLSRVVHAWVLAHTDRARSWGLLR